MSRSGYSDDWDDPWAMIRWRGAVASAIRGKRGQAFLRELLEALDAMPEKRLQAAEELVTADGEYCALGALGHARGLNMAPIDPQDRGAVADAFGVAEALAAEIMYENDNTVCDDFRTVNFPVCGPMRPWEGHTQLRRVPDEAAARRRWGYMRAWVAAAITTERLT